MFNSAMTFVLFKESKGCQFNIIFKKMKITKLYLSEILNKVPRNFADFFIRLLPTQIDLFSEFTFY